MFKIRHDLIRNGDVILSRVPNDIISTSICVATGSRYSHASLVVNADQRLCIEAVGVGVRNFSIERVLIHSKENVGVFRHESATPEQLLEVCQCAQNHMQKKYSVKAAVASRLSPLPIKMPYDSAFCSYLVAAAFSEAHLPLSDKEASKVWPGDLALAKVLKNITDDVLTECHSEPSPVQWYLDGRSPRKILQDLENQFAQNVLRDIKPLILEQGYSNPLTQIDDIRNFICWYVERNSMPKMADKFSELDQKLFLSLQCSGYLTLDKILVERMHIDLRLDAYLAEEIRAKIYDVKAACLIHEVLLNDMGVYASDLNSRSRDLFRMQWFDAQLEQLGVKSNTVRALVEQRKNLATISRTAYEAVLRAVDVLTNAIRRGAISLF